MCAIASSENGTEAILADRDDEPISPPQVSEEFRYDPDGRRYARQSTWQESGTTHKEHVTSVGNLEIVYDTSNGAGSFTSDSNGNKV